MTKRKVLIIIACVVGGLAASGTILRLDGSGDELSFKVAEVTRGDLENVISTTGTLSAVGTVEVGAQVSGTLADVLVDYNDEVVEGQLLATVDDTFLAASVKDAEAGVLKAEAQLRPPDWQVQAVVPIPSSAPSLPSSKAATSNRPIAAPSGIGTALPICRAMSSRLPTHR